MHRLLSIDRQSPKSGADTTASSPPGATGRLRRVPTGESVGDPGDRLEREADAVADRVVTLPVAVGGSDGERKASSREPGVAAAPGVGRSVRALPDPVDAPGPLPGPGRPLSSAERGFFEPRFGVDFARVRIHTDAEAADLARGLNAAAFTIGSHIVFDAAAALPSTRHLLAHELTHVVQQTGGLSTTDAAIPAVSKAPVVPGMRVQRRLAAGTRAADQGTPELDDAKVKTALEYNRARLKGVDSALLGAIEDLVGKRRDTPALDATLIGKIARWQSWHRLPPDGRMTPLTARTMAHEIRRAHGRLAKWDMLGLVEEKYPGYGRRTTEKLGALDRKIAAAGFRKPGEEAAVDEDFTVPGSLGELRQAISPDLENNAGAAARWRDRAYTVRFDGEVDESTKSDLLGEIATQLAAHDAMTEAMEVLSLIALESESSRQAMAFALKRIGSSATKDAQTARAYLSALLRLTGGTESRAADPQAWFEKNTAAVGEAIRVMEGILGAEAALQLMTSVLKSGFAKDTAYEAVPGRAGSVAKLRKEQRGDKDLAKSKMLADCDVYAVYGARLGRGAGWRTIGYFSFQTSDPDDVTHAIGLLRRDVTAGSEYMVLDSEKTSFLYALGTLADDDAARAKAVEESASGWPLDYRFYAPALADGSIDPRLLQHNPTDLKYP